MWRIRLEGAVQRLPSARRSSNTCAGFEGQKPTTRTSDEPSKKVRPSNVSPAGLALLTLAPEINSN
jgi:hypothetical protein